MSGVNQSRVGDLIGRDRELELIDAFLTSTSQEQPALLLSGEPGVGKTVLLDAATERASAGGMRVLRAAGVEFEADVSFSGLNQLLLPLMDELRQLAPPLRSALEVALGLGDGATPDRLLVANATLETLRRAASRGPVLVVVDDVQWLDRSSASVLASVARRLAGTGVAFLGAFRDGFDTCFEAAAIPQYELPPLERDAADTLLRVRFPDLVPRVRARVVAEAQGNPLALTELPVALSGAHRAAMWALPTALPLSRRLEDLFATRVSDLPISTRRLLLVAVLDASGDLRVLQAIAGAPGGIDDLGPAERARLIEVDTGTRSLTFRHPLIRSAVISLSTDDERRRAHRDLAELLVDQPERRAWHLAEATLEPDEAVAQLLEEAAQLILARGDARGAVAALIRAAELSPRADSRSRRLGEAAYIGACVSGDIRDVPNLLAEARRVDPQFKTSLHGASISALLLLNGDGDVDTAHHLLAGTIEDRARANDVKSQEVVDTLFTLFTTCHWGGRAELWEPFDKALSRLSPDGPSDLYLLSKFNADPVCTAVAAQPELTRAIAGLREADDPWHTSLVSSAANTVDRISECRESLWRILREEHDAGAVVQAINALNLLSRDDLVTGQWDEADDLAGRGATMCEAHGYLFLEWMAWHVQSMVAALRGDLEHCRSLTDQLVGWAAPRRAAYPLACAQQVLGLAALGQGDFDTAYRLASAIGAPGTVPSHAPVVAQVVMDLVESAARTGRYSEAVAHVAAIRDTDIPAMSTRLALLVAASAGIVAPDADAPACFEEALAAPDASRWPFEYARVRLLYGERLRRARATTEARVHLASALETFERLGAIPWAARAGAELRAAGVGVGRGRHALEGTLTAQELEIAGLAASGLTNREIAERLFLSHRTVGAHLYRIFPKLGVTSRAALRDALGDA